MRCVPAPNQGGCPVRDLVLNTSDTASPEAVPRIRRLNPFLDTLSCLSCLCCTPRSSSERFSVAQQCQSSHCEPTASHFLVRQAPGGGPGASTCRRASVQGGGLAAGGRRRGATGRARLPSFSCQSSRVQAEGRALHFLLSPFVFETRARKPTAWDPHTSASSCPELLGARPLPRPLLKAPGHWQKGDGHSALWFEEPRRERLCFLLWQL